jgi:hypothetical protein
MSSTHGDQLEGQGDKRGLWERPVLRRIDANDAKANGSFGDDGRCGGTGQMANHHSCPPG